SRISSRRSKISLLRDRWPAASPGHLFPVSFWGGHRENRPQPRLRAQALACAVLYKYHNEYGFNQHSPVRPPQGLSCHRCLALLFRSLPRRPGPDGSPLYRLSRTPSRQKYGTSYLARAARTAAPVGHRERIWSARIDRFPWESDRITIHGGR